MKTVLHNLQFKLHNTQIAFLDARLAAESSRLVYFVLDVRLVQNEAETGYHYNYFRCQTS